MNRPDKAPRARCRVILHAGTPKTGTTALQVYLERHREDMRLRGILYAPVEGPTYPMPKHQWIVNALMAPDAGDFSQRISDLLESISTDIQTLILSTEGLYNHWWDFSAAGRQALGRLAEAASVEVWVWFRDPIEFVRSNYAQKLRDPPGYVSCYGQDLSVDEMLDDPWFAKQLDYIGFVRDFERLLEVGKVVPFVYTGDTVTDCLTKLGVSARPRSAAREHASLGSTGVRLVRAINRRHLDVSQRQRAIAFVNKLDASIGPLSPPLRLTASTRERIRALAEPSTDALSREFGLDLG